MGAEVDEISDAVADGNDVEVEGSCVAVVEDSGSSDPISTPYNQMRLKIDISL